MSALLTPDVSPGYFDGCMVPPYLELSAPGSARVYGATRPISGFGGRLQIQIRPSLVTGQHARLRSGTAFAEGRARFVADVLLHEMIHQWQLEVLGEGEDGYHGHGPLFRDRANLIGQQLGLPPVRTSKARGPDKALPSCAQWPHNVRPDEYYLGAYIRDVPTDGDDTDERVLEPVVVLSLEDQLAAMTSVELGTLLATVMNHRAIGDDDDPDGMEDLVGQIVFRLDDAHQDALVNVTNVWLGVDDDEEPAC